MLAFANFLDDLIRERLEVARIARGDDAVVGDEHHERVARQILRLEEVEEVARTLYIRALKLLPRDIKQGFERLMQTETDATGRTILGTIGVRGTEFIVDVTG